MGETEAVAQDAPASWPVSSSAEVFRNWLISVRNDQVRMPAGGGVAERFVVTHPGAVCVLALDDAGRALMIRQYRHPVGRLLWELPAGLRDHPGEPLVAAAQRELMEETGYRASTWHTLVDDYSSPGFTTERVRIFLARGLEPASAGDRYVREHEEALIVTGWLPLPDAVQAILAGKLHNGHTIAGLLAGYAASAQGFAGLRPADAPEDDMPAGPALESTLLEGTALEGTALGDTAGLPATCGQMPVGLLFPEIPLGRNWRPACADWCL
jgi:ADP-ribose pyrophosphatase